MSDGLTSKNWPYLPQLILSQATGSGQKKLNLKKQISELWEDTKRDAIEKVNNAVSPADAARSFIMVKLESVSSMGSEGLVHILPSSVIELAGDSAYRYVSSIWSHFVGAFIWPDVPVSELHNDVVNESWAWNWNIGAEIQFSEMSISLDPKIRDIVNLIDAISETGFSSETFEAQSIQLNASVTADGKIANADFNSCLNMFLRYTKKMTVDIETEETADGHFDFGVGVSLHIWF